MIHPNAEESRPSNGSSGFYRTVWRWHFYAGVVTAPLAIFLAITGSIYLWKPQYEAARYRDLLRVQPLYTATFAGVQPQPLRVAADTQFATAVKSHPGARVVSFTPSFAPGQTSETILRLADGDTVSVFVDPHLGRVVGERRESERFMTTIHDLHGELLIGRTGNYVVELGASWLFVLLLTGLYLWWPRPTFSVWGFFLPRLRAKGRVFWRDLHAVPAVWASVGALFLLSTGIPWTQVSGAWFKRISAALGEGTPRESSAGAHRSELTGWSPPLRAGLANEIDTLASTPPAPTPPPPPAQVMIHDENDNMIWVDRSDPRAQPKPLATGSTPPARPELVERGETRDTPLGPPPADYGAASEGSAPAGTAIADLETGRGLRSPPSTPQTGTAADGPEQSEMPGAAGNGSERSDKTGRGADRTIPALPPEPVRRGPPDPASLEWCSAVMGPGMKNYPISLERVITLATERHVPLPYAIAPPLDETAVFSVISDRHQAFSRTYLHLDQYSGAVLADVRYRDFGLWGKFVLWGIIAHEGQLFGLLNQILGTFAAFGVFYIAVSALMLWWHRRPEGGFAGAPARIGKAGLPRPILIGAGVLSIALPLLAASFALFWLVDRSFVRRSL